MAKAKANQGLLPATRLQAIDATATPTATGKRAAGPSTISAPAAMPVAGQKKPKPACDLRAKPSRAARK